MVAIHSNPRKALSTSHALRTSRALRGASAWVAKIIQRQRARLNLHYVGVFEWICNEAVDPIGAGAEFDRPDREGRDALVVVSPSRSGPSQNHHCGSSNCDVAKSEVASWTACGGKAHSASVMVTQV
jgi:hypothetical protein